VPHGLTEVRGQCLLPGLAVADLFAAREAVAIRVDAARIAGIGKHPTGVELVIAVLADRSIHAFRKLPVAMEIAQFAVVLTERKRLLLEPEIDILAAQEEGPQIIANLLFGRLGL